MDASAPVQCGVDLGRQGRAGQGGAGSMTAKQASAGYEMIPKRVGTMYARPLTTEPVTAAVLLMCMNLIQACITMDFHHHPQISAGSLIGPWNASSGFYQGNRDRRECMFHLGEKEREPKRKKKAKKKDKN